MVFEYKSIIQSFQTQIMYKKTDMIRNIFSKSENTTSTFLSHLFLWEKAVELNEDVVIFEHDAVVFDKIPTDAIFKGCMTFSKPSYGNYQTPIHIGPGPLTQKPYFGGAHGYIVSPEGAKRLIAKAPTHAGPADIYLNKNNFSIDISIKKPSFNALTFFLPPILALSFDLLVEIHLSF